MLDELFSIALHEARHVFGLSYSDEPNSPMHVHGISDSIKLLPEDIEQLIALHGDRERDWTPLILLCEREIRRCNPRQTHFEDTPLASVLAEFGGTVG